jgi:glycosyltransferase involved in cell wall biosynthesis
VKLLLTADPVLPVPPTFYGGIERIIASLIGTLRSRGHVVGLVAHRESSVPTEYLVGWPHLEPKSVTEHMDNAMALRRATKEFGPALIHSFSRLLYTVPSLWSELPKLMSYQRPTGGAQITIAARLGGQTLAFTGCSEFIANMGRPYGGTWYAIPNFVDTAIYEFSAFVPDDAPLVFLSRIERIKGTHIAIEVALRTGRRLLIAGNKAQEGPELRYWEESIEPHIGRNGIEYIGPVDDAAKIQLLGTASAMIVPIQWDEPFGIVFAEALSCGTPVISTPRGALPEIVRSGVDGFLVDDVDAACRAVHRLPQLDRRECRRRAEEKFSSVVVVGQYEALYESLLDR